VKWQRLPNKALRTIGKFPKRTLVRELHMALQIPYIYIYDYITKLCCKPAEVIQYHENENVRDIGKRETRHRKCKRLNLGGGEKNDHSGD
jgi:hypothetical protein